MLLSRFGILLLAGCESSFEEGGVAPEGVGIRLHEDIESLATVTWTQADVGVARVEYAVVGEDLRSTPPVDLGAGTHEQLVVGLPYDTEFTWRVVIDADVASASADATFRTGELPDDMPEPEVLVSDAERYEPSGVFLMGSVNRNPVGWSAGEFWKYILDRQGRVVWADATPDRHWTLYVQPSADGRAILWDEATFWSDWESEGADSVVHRWKIDGTEEAVYATPGLHHSFTQLPDETLVWGAAAGYYETLEQLPPGGVQSTIWDCEAFHAEIGVNKECQSNSIWWDAATDTFLFSFYTTNTIVEIDHATGTALRRWGALPDAWTFDPPDSQFAWQHGPSWTEDGHLLVSSERDERETVVYEYELDDASETLTEVWSFGKGEGVYGTTNGEAHRLANGNTLHNLGASGRLREVTPEGDVVWDVTLGDDRLLGRSIFLDDLYAFAP